MAKKVYGGSSPKQRNWDVEEFGSATEDSKQMRDGNAPFELKAREVTSDEALSDVRARKSKEAY